MVDRFNFTMPDDGILDELRMATRRTSKAEVVRDAIAVYKMLVNRARNGDKLFIGRTRNDAGEMVITSLEHLQNEPAFTRTR